MTKAERRELQEKQRAEKAALKAQHQQGGGGQSKQSSKSSGQSQKKPQAGETSKAVSSTTTDAINDATGGKMVSRSLRIFTHFGLPKPISHVKGDIHPAILRLGLLFSEFKICGANARCIATLTAFKSVRPAPYRLIFS